LQSDGSESLDDGIPGRFPRGVKRLSVESYDNGVGNATGVLKNVNTHNTVDTIFLKKEDFRKPKQQLQQRHVRKSSFPKS